MNNKKIGFLHPGEMGISLLASARNSDQTVYWCSAGRSEATQTRAKQYNTNTCHSLVELCQVCDIIIAVCPPHAAHTQALAVINAGFQGIYSDVNAISPQSVKLIASNMTAAGIDFVDGGIIGLPAWQKNSTWLYLAGEKANIIAQCFNQGPLETSILGLEIGMASALKMCFAANSKGVSAMLTAILGAAEQYGVRDALEKQWDVFEPGFSLKSKTRIQTVARKAWRFTGEMDEIAATLAAAGLPADFHRGAADIYARQKSFKDTEELPTIETILDVCLNNTVNNVFNNDEDLK